MVSPDQPILSPAERRFLSEARRAILATVGLDGCPRLVPICFVLADRPDPRGRPVLYSPIDEKPKRSNDPLRIARVRDLLVVPEVALLVDRWDEDWTHLAWLRIRGTAKILEPEPPGSGEHASAVAALRAKYPQYLNQRLEDRPLIRIVADRSRSWGAIE